MVPLAERGFLPRKMVVKFSCDMAIAIVTAENKSDTHPQAMLHRIAPHWLLLDMRRSVESEPVTAVCNVRMYQTQL